MNERQIDDAANTLQAVISALGRDDIGVGEVSQREGVIYFTLTKGHFTQSALRFRPICWLTDSGP